MWKGEFEQYPMLKTAINTDVLIIGGGIAGILAARLLADSGLSCVIVEAGRLCGGITRNTTAKITVHHGLIYSKITEKYGKDYAKMYLSANLRAAERFEELCAKIDCDYKKQDSFIYSKSDPAPLYSEISALSDIGFHAKFVESVPLPFRTAGAVCVKNQAQFNPLPLLAELSKGLEIYENTRIIELKNNTAISVDGKITAKKIVVATHFPFVNSHGSYFLKMYQSRSHVIALENAEFPDGIFMDADENGLSFRKCNIENAIERKKSSVTLVGGGAHKTGCPSKSGELFAFAKEYFPSAKITNAWAAQDCITLDGLPYIGNYSAKTPDLYVMTGFNKWGMTNSLAAAEIIRDKILGIENENAPVFNPSRSILTKQLFINGLNAAKNLVTPTAPRCPHMGCALKKNKEENTWDCPCHGSRFTENGELIDNPANSGLDRK